MEPEIHYCTTKDGIRIAYTVRGEGLPLVQLTPFIETFSPGSWAIREEWRDQHQRSLILYDGRGTGLSQRDVDDLSFDARLRDLEAVLDACRARSFDLWGVGWSGPVAIAYSARYPRRVRHLILNSTFSRAADVVTWARLKPQIDLAISNWGLASQVFADMVERNRETDPIEADQAGKLARVYRESAIAEIVAEWLTRAFEIDVTGLLSQVKAPTLVLGDRAGRWAPFALAQDLAVRITNARLVTLDDRRMETVWAAVAAFLGDSPQRGSIDRTGAATPEAPPTSLPSGTAIILFADIVDSTPLTETLGDTAFRDKTRELDNALREHIRGHAGTPIDGKLLGDGVLATFASAKQAIEAALACGRAGGEMGLPLHLGLHAGDVIREDNNVFGGAVNIAARVSALSAPGEVLVSGTVRDLARTSAGVSFEDRGEQAMKGVGEAVRVFRVVKADR